MGPRSPLRLEAINGIRGRTTPIIPTFSLLSGHETLPRTPLFTFHVPLLACDGWMSNCSYFHQHIGNISSLEGRLLCIKRPWITYILESAKHIVRGVQHMALNLSVSSGTVNAKKVNWGEPWAAFSRVQVVRYLSILSTEYVTELRWALSSPLQSTGGRISE